MEDAWVKVNNPEWLALKLEEFYKNTGASIDKMQEKSSIPSFDDFRIARRHNLGKNALELAQKIRGQSAISQVIEEAFQKVKEEGGSATEATGSGGVQE